MCRALVKVTNGIRSCRADKEKLQRIRMRMRQRYRIAEDETVYLFAGRVSAEKGVAELVEAFVKARDSLQKCRLIIVGSAYSGSNEINHYMKRILELAQPYRDRILITGYVPHKYVLNYHAMADVQVVPSIMEDPAPLTVLEGMSMGLYMLLSNVGGIPEYSERYRNRMLFERDDHFVENIRNALIAYHERYPTNAYQKQKLLYDAQTFYREFISALQFDEEVDAEQSAE